MRKVTDYYQLDLTWLQRRKMLTPGRVSVVTWSVGGTQTGAIRVVAQEHAIVLIYRTRSWGETWQDAREVVPFITKPTAFGGRRRWFACPRCAMDCRILYGNGRFLCRRCWGIGYRSPRETPWSRAISRMHKLRARLGGSSNLMESFPPRPRYMHHRTYHNLRVRYMALSGQNTAAELEGFLFRLKKRVGRPV